MIIPPYSHESPKIPAKGEGRCTICLQNVKTVNGKLSQHKDSTLKTICKGSNLKPKAYN